MSERGFAKTKTMKGALYSGIGLRTADHYDSPHPPAVPRYSGFAHEEEGEEV
jgi:hypothetical protein